MSKKLSVSMMCADLLNLEQQIRLLERLKVDYLHIDIMDAAFVPNLTFGPDTINAMRELTDIPFDIHFLMNNPQTIMRSIQLRPGDIVTIHSESKANIMETIAFVKNANALFGLALNPETPVAAIKKFFPYIDVVLLMLIVPGFAGSPILHDIMEKVTVTKRFLENNHAENILIEVDGSVSRERAQYMGGLGADIFVGGTAGIFRKEERLEVTVPKFYESIGIEK